MAPDSPTRHLRRALAPPIQPVSGRACRQAGNDRPPKAPLAFRVGVAGHRPDRLQGADMATLGQVIRSVLIAVAEEVRDVGQEHAPLFAEGPVQLRAVSPLAEGVDRLFADQALDLGWELCCVMPFPQAEFEQDFAPPAALESDSLARFRGLLARAEQVAALTRFELDGSRADAPGAYWASGTVILNQSDLLIVVWDGDRRAHRGGTEHILDEARRRGVPTIWIQAQNPHSWQRLHSSKAPSDGPGDGAAIRRVVRQALELPSSAAAPGPSVPTRTRGPEVLRRRLERFYRERTPISWRSALRPVSRGGLADLEGDGLGSTVSGPRSPRLRAPMAHADLLRPHYAWPDRLAVMYSKRYRNAYSLAYGLAAFAVAMALFPIAMGWPGLSFGAGVFTVLELLAIGAVLLVVLWGRRSSWHDRWLDYRLAAELVRHLRLASPVGGPMPSTQVSAHLAGYGAPGSTWMDWYVRGVSRAYGLPNAVVDRRHLQDCLVELEELLSEQKRYHRKRAGRCHTVEHWLHVGGLTSLALTLLACCLHLFHLGFSAEVLTSISGFLPALGAALAGISNQGEFRRVSKRSEAMEQQLGLLVERVVALRDGVPDPGQVVQLSSAQVGYLSEEAARLLVSEVLDWRVVFVDRPLTPPA